MQLSCTCMSLSSNCRCFCGTERMQPLEPFLHMLNLRGAFLAVPSYGTPDWLRVSLELEHDGASLLTEDRPRLFKTAQSLSNRK